MPANAATTAEQIFTLVKGLPQKEQQALLSEIKKLELIYRARLADASIKKESSFLSDADIQKECDIIRKQHYEQGRQ